MSVYVCVSLFSVWFETNNSWYAWQIFFVYLEQKLFGNILKDSI